MIGFFSKKKDDDSKIFELSIFCDTTQKTFTLRGNSIGTMSHSINFTCPHCRVYEYIMLKNFSCDDKWRKADSNYYTHKFKIDRGNMKRFIREKNND